MQDPNYMKAWQDYKRRRRIFVGMFFGWIPYGVTVSAIWQGLGLPQNTIFFALLPFMIGIAVVGNWFLRFKCPRCKENFFTRGAFPFMYSNQFTRKCLHCELELYAENDSGPQVSEDTFAGLIMVEKIFDVSNVFLQWLLVLFGLLSFYVFLMQDKDAPMAELIAFAAMALSIVTTILCLLLLTSIKGLTWQRLLKELLPNWALVTLPALAALSSLVPIYLLFWQKGQFIFAPPHIGAYQMILTRAAPFQCLFAFYLLKAIQVVRERVRKNSK